MNDGRPKVRPSFMYPIYLTFMCILTVIISYSRGWMFSTILFTFLASVCVVVLFLDRRKEEPDLRWFQ